MARWPLQTSSGGTNLTLLRAHLPEPAAAPVRPTTRRLVLQAERTLVGFPLQTSSGGTNYRLHGEPPAMQMLQVERTHSGFTSIFFRRNELGRSSNDDFCFHFAHFLQVERTDHCCTLQTSSGGTNVMALFVAAGRHFLQVERTPASDSPLFLQVERTSGPRHYKLLQAERTVQRICVSQSGKRFKWNER